MPLRPRRRRAAAPGAARAPRRAPATGSQTSQHGAVRRGRRPGRRSGAGSPRAGSRRPRRRPRPRGTGASARRWASRRRGAARAAGAPVEGREHPPAHAVHRRRRRLQHARAREVADDRPDAARRSSRPRRAPRRRRRSGRRRRRPSSRRATRSSVASPTSARWMKKTCRPLSAALGEQQRPRRRAVAPGAPGLLVVGLDRRRDARVGDRAHVGLVDAHAERVRGHDDLDLAGHEAPLRRPRARSRPRPAW